MIRSIFDKRTITKFAFLPTLLDDGKEVWFVKYNINQYWGTDDYNGNSTWNANRRTSQNYWVTYKTYKD